MAEGVGGRGGAQEGPFFRAKIDILILDLDYDSVFYTPNAPVGCGGGLSTLRGTPPPHLFDVDPFLE